MLAHELESRALPARDFVAQDFFELPDQQQVLPPLMSAYQERGYAAGYGRGRNDALIAILALTEEFARLDPSMAADTRRTLYAFSDFLERRIVRTAPQSHGSFIDGLGI